MLYYSKSKQQRCEISLKKALYFALRHLFTLENRMESRRINMDTFGATLSLERQYKLALAIQPSAEPLRVAKSFFEVLCPMLDLKTAVFWVFPLEDNEQAHLQFLFRWPNFDADLLPKTESISARVLLRRWGFGNSDPLSELFFGRSGTEVRLGWRSETGVFLAKTENPEVESEWKKFKPILDTFAVTLRQSLRLQTLEKAEQELLLREKKHMQIMETSPDAVVLVEDDALVSEWSSRAEQLFGFSAQEIIGERWYQLIMPPEDWANMDLHRHQFYLFGKLPPNQFKPLEFIATRKDGTRFPAEMNYSHLHLEGKNLFVLFFRDIRLRKNAEEEILRAKKEAEEARAAEEAFLARMSHEIRSPLNVVIGVSQALERKDLGHDVRELLAVLTSTSKNLLEIVNDVLDMAKIRAGSMEIRPKPFELRRWLETIEQSVRLMLAQKPVRFQLDTDESLPAYIVADESRLNQILLNLLHNAMKFTREGVIHLQVRCCPGKQGELCVSLSDTGLGMDPEYLERVFHEFSQENKVPELTPEGSGLGLSIVKKLVNLMSGTVSVESIPDKGTTFRLGIPYEEVQTSLANPPIEEPEPLTPEQQEVLRNSSILVIEDEAMNQQLLKNILGDCGCQVQIRGDAELALRESREKPFDIILMDLHLPGHSGLDLARTIREDPGNPNRETPIIALTASTRASDPRRTREAGMQEILLKPYSLHALQQALVVWLQRSANGYSGPIL